MFRSSNFLKLPRSKVTIGDYCYVSKTFDNYPPLPDDDIGHHYFWSDPDVLDGVRGHIYKYPYYSYDIETPTTERLVPQRHEVYNNHYFAYKELESNGNLRLVAFKPTFVFVTAHQEEKLYRNNVQRGSGECIGDIPVQVEYVLKYGVSTPEDIIELTQYGELYYSREVCEEYPNSCIWRVTFDSNYLTGDTYPRVIKTLKKYYLKKEKETCVARYEKIRRQELSHYMDRNIGRVIKHLQIRNYLKENWVRTSQDPYQAVLAKQYLEELSPSTINLLLPYFRERIEQSTLDLILESSQPRSASSSLTLASSVSTQRKRTRIGEYKQDSIGSREELYYLEDSNDENEEESHKLQLPVHNDGYYVDRETVEEHQYYENSPSEDEYQESLEDTDEEI